MAIYRFGISLFIPQNDRGSKLGHSEANRDWQRSLTTSLGLHQLATEHQADTGHAGPRASAIPLRVPSRGKFAGHSPNDTYRLWNTPDA